MLVARVLLLPLRGLVSLALAGAGQESARGLGVRVEQVAEARAVSVTMGQMLRAQQTQAEAGVPPVRVTSQARRVALVLSSSRFQLRRL